MSAAGRKRRAVFWRAGRGLVLLLAALVLFYLVVPLFVVLPISFSSSWGLEFPPPGFSLQWYLKYFSNARWLQATQMSFRVGAGAALLATVLGTLAALALQRGRLPGRSLIEAFILSPLIIPVIILAVALYLPYARLSLIGNPWGLVLAHALLAMPFVVINVTAALGGLDTTLERAAMVLGANPWQAFWAVTFPLIRPGILTGAIFAFITSFDEVVIALFVGGWTAETLPKLMWETLRTGIDPTIAAVSVMLIVLSISVLASAYWLQARSRQALLPE